MRWRPGAGAGGSMTPAWTAVEQSRGVRVGAWRCSGFGLPKIACDGYWLGKVWY
jgi:hypothetical protein